MYSTEILNWLKNVSLSNVCSKHGRTSACHASILIAKISPKFSKKRADVFLRSDYKRD